MKTFKHITALSVEDATSALEQHGGKARIIAGGTDLLGEMKDCILPDDGYPEVLVDIKRIADLDYVRVMDGAGDTDTSTAADSGLRIGALTRLEDLAMNDLVRQKWPALAEAAHRAASPQIREMGTVAGNICQNNRCWYYWLENNRFDCMRKGGATCYALTGDARYHSIFGSAPVVTRPCKANCPGSVDIPVYMERLRAGDVAGAAQILLEKNPLPAITGRVCPHACEQHCNRDVYDEPVSVRTVERYLGDYVLEHAAELLGSPAASGGRVAVVGAGPAGLACAFYLRHAGHPVTVFEKMPEAGGMLRYGIPPYRLSVDTVRQQTRVLEAMGIEFRLGVEVGVDIQLVDLRRDFDSVFLAPGAWSQPNLSLEHEEFLSPGLPLLQAAKEGEVRSMTGRVVVIGGGNVAVDVALTARRLGADEVTMVCLEGEQEMPALSWEVEEARRAGVRVFPSWGPARILVEDGRLTGLDLIRCACVFDDSGRFNPTYDRDVTNTIPADVVFLAIGQRADLTDLDPDGTLRAGRNWIATDKDTMETTLEGVFAGGDVVSGPSTVIAAIAAGRKAAESMIRRLAGGRAVGPHSRQTPPFCSFNSDFLAKTPRGATPVAADSAPGLLRAGLGSEETVTASWEQVEYEANRCFNCGCVAVSPSDLAPALVALNATIMTTRRTIAAEHFFVVGVNRSTVLDDGEMVLEIQVPEPAPETRSAFVKFALRKSIDFPLVNCAAALEMADGVVKSARICLNSVAGIPVRATAAEQHLLGRLLGHAVAEQAADAAMQDALPLLNNRYKIQVARTLVKRAILSCG